MIRHQGFPLQAATPVRSWSTGAMSVSVALSCAGEQPEPSQEEHEEHKEHEEHMVNTTCECDKHCNVGRAG